MPENMFYGAVSLLGVQLITFIAGAVIYSRQKSAIDIEKRDRGTFEPRVTKALQAAMDALAGVERIDIEQYRALSKKLADAYNEIEMLKGKITALEEMCRTIITRNATRDRRERIAEEKAAAAEREPLDDTMSNHAGEIPAGQIKIPDGVDPIEYLKSIGIAKSVAAGGYQQLALPLNNTPSTFGKKAR